MLRNGLLGGSILALGLVTAPVVSPAALPSTGRFPTSSGKAVYQVRGKTLNGSLTLYWKEYGRRCRQEARVVERFRGKSIPIHTWAIANGEAMYWRPPGSPGSVSKSRCRMPDSLAVVFAGLPLIAPRPAEVKASGRGEVLGKPCSVYKKYGTDAWFWKGLLLKAHQHTHPRVVKLVATELDTSADVPDRLFVLPANIRITQAVCGNK